MVVLHVRDASRPSATSVHVLRRRVRYVPPAPHDLLFHFILIKLTRSSPPTTANFDQTTTPFRSVKYDEAASRKPPNTKPNGRAAVAGPSTKAGNANARRARRRSPSPSHDNEEDDESVEVPAPTRKTTRPKRAASREPEPVAPAKAKPAARGKGKGKAKAESVKDTSDDAMDIDNLENIREVEDESEGTHNVALTAPPVRKTQPRSAIAGQAAWKKQEARLREKIGRLEAQLTQVSYEVIVSL